MPKTTPPKPPVATARAAKPKPPAREASAEVEQRGKRRQVAAEVNEAPTAKPARSRRALESDVEEAVVEQAPAVITASRTGIIKVPSILTSKAFAELSALVDKVEAQTEISTSTLSTSSFVKNAIASGCLMYDFVSGGGVAPGRFTIVPGREGSGKSTLVNYLASTCVLQGTPIYWFDAESALSPDYVSKIFSKFGLRFGELLGVRDMKNKARWEVPPIIRYSDDSIGERVFKTMHGMLKILPTVRQDSNGNWWKLIVGKTKKEWVEDEREGRPQYLFIVDSWPALLPEAIDENPDKSPMAVQARMFSDNIKLVKALLGQKNCVLFSTNQLRLNPGARMCVHGDTSVTLVDGRTLSIREIVEKKIKAKVWSLNEKTGKIEPKRITGWYKNGDVQSANEWISFKTRTVNTSNGVCGFTVTHDHKVITDSGWKRAEDITLNDRLVTRNPSIINGTLREFLAGTSIGDLSLATWKIGNSVGRQASLTLCNNEQPEYLQWKLGKLLDHFTFTEYKYGRYGKIKDLIAAGERKKETKNFTSFRSNARYDLKQWKDLIGPRSARNIYDDFTALSLAVWYMDDGNCDNGRTSSRGCITAKRFKGNEEELGFLVALLAKFGIETTVEVKVGRLNFTAENFTKLCRVICKYVPPCMQYKLAEEFRGKYKDFKLKAKEETVLEYVEITEINRGSTRKFREPTKYDITVEDNHNYMVGNPQNGVIVHNSDPVYEPGGEALKFYSDNRTRIMRVSPNTAGVPSGAGAKFSEEPGLNGGVDRFVYAKIQNTKNKAFAPFRESTFRIRFLKDGAPGDGICESWDCASYLQATGQMLQRGNTMTMHVRPTKEKGKDNPLFEDGQRINRAQFKELVEAPRFKRAVYMHCLRQIRGGYAFQLERESMSRLIAAGGEESAAVSDDSGVEA